MPTITTILPSNAPVVTSKGLFTGEWYRYFTGQNRVTNSAVAGEVTTLPASGLEGGGPVSEGITISIAPNGVTNAMLRESAATSVIGRFQNTSGDVADIIAVADHRVLTREGGQLAFRPDLDGVSVGTNDAAPLVRYDALETTETAAASTATVTHSIPIETAGGTMYILLSSTP